MFNKVLNLGAKQLGQLCFGTHKTQRIINSVVSSHKSGHIAFFRHQTLLFNHHFLPLKRSIDREYKKLEKELRTIAKHTEFIPLNTAIQLLNNSSVLEKNYAVMLFEHAYMRDLDASQKMCIRLDLPACFFVPTSQLETGMPVWTKQLEIFLNRIAPEPVKVTWLDRELATTSQADRHYAYDYILKQLLEYCGETRATNLIELLKCTKASKFAINPISAKDIAHLCKNPLFSYGSNGYQHFPLNARDNLQSRCEQEAVERLRNIAPSNFASVFRFPFSAISNIDNDIIYQLKSWGYIAGISCSPGIARPSDPLFSLPTITFEPTGTKTLSYLASLNNAKSLLRDFIGYDSQ